MIFKVLLIGGLVFYFFRMLSVPKITQNEKTKINHQENDDYVDYEEIE